MTKPVTLVIIEDNPLVREGLGILIRERPGFTVLAESAEIGEVAHTVREAKPDVVLMDFSLSDNDSLKFTRTVCSEVPEAKVIIMGILPIQDDIAEFVLAGAAGFVMKDATLELFLETIQRVADGEKVLPPKMAGSLFTQITSRAVRNYGDASRDAVRLTPMEREVLGLIGEGMTNHETAARLKLAVHVVKNHMDNVLEKLVLHTGIEIATNPQRDSDS